ncbi:unnamed protein product [Brassica napus]|uniref:(rape) hypothetical protein n=1 Tax=Brassica napus TaxID=3708 RepID=A0A816WX27_BRANA|nr:unnamed protein product [Brassica napus]
MMLINQTPTIELGFQTPGTRVRLPKTSETLVRWSESLTTGKWIN